MTYNVCTFFSLLMIFPKTRTFANLTVSTAWQVPAGAMQRTTANAKSSGRWFWPVWVGWFRFISFSRVIFVLFVDYRQGYSLAGFSGFSPVTFFFSSSCILLSSLSYFSRWVSPPILG